MKKCARCGEVGKFYRRRVAQTQSYCTGCVKDYSRLWMRERYQKKLELKSNSNPARYPLCACGDYFTRPLGSTRTTCRNCSGMKTGRLPEKILNTVSKRFT
jgi:hypothetical protein